jgi:hypothetical protein
LDFGWCWLAWPSYDSEEVNIQGIGSAEPMVQADGLIGVNRRRTHMPVIYCRGLPTLSHMQLNSWSFTTKGIPDDTIFITVFYTNVNNGRRFNGRRQERTNRR